MNVLQRLLAPKNAKQIDVEFLRPAFVNGVRFDVGEIARFDAGTVKELCGCGAAFDPKDDIAAKARAERLASLLPPPGTARPAPDGFDKLPICFRQWWDLNEKGLLIIHRAAEIEECYSKRMGKRTLPSLKGLELLPQQDQKRLISGINFSVGEIPAHILEADRHLRDALERSLASIETWREINGQELLRLRIACSDHAQLVHGKLAKEIRELHGMARELFSIRIAALGLSETHVERLFCGSADANRFASIEVPALQGQRLAWVEESGQPRFYLDRIPTIMAGLIRDWTSTGEDVARLTAQVRKELAAARKVSQAA